MESYKRIIRMHALLGSGNFVTKASLMSATAASRSTFQRDVDFLRDDLHAPLENVRNMGYRYRPDAPVFELPGLWFNQSELFALLSADRLLEAVQPGVLSAHLAPFRARLRELLEKSGHPAQEIAQRVMVPMVGARRVNHAAFGPVAAAVLAGTPLALVYDGRSRDQRTQRVVHPYRLINYRHNWYLVAWCDLRAGLRTFALDCMHDFTPLRTPLRALPAAQLEPYLSDNFGIFAGGATQWAVLRFNAQAARWVSAEQWHPHQIGEWLASGEYELTIPYSSPQELIMEVLKHGPDVEAMSPPELRTQVMQRLAAAMARYDEAK